MTTESKISPEKIIINWGLKLLTRKIYSALELQKKLIKKFPQEEDNIEKALKFLKKENLLNDREYVRTYLNYQIKNNIKVKFAYQNFLKQKGISKELFLEIWQEISPNKLEMMMQLIKNNEFRFNNEKNLQQKKGKIFRFLSQRGFLSKDIYENMEGFLDLFIDK